MEYACPKCKLKLKKINTTLTCLKCSKEWHVENDIPIFSEHEGYWAHLPRDKMVDMLNTARRDGWKRAVEVHLRPESTGLPLDLRGYIYGQERAKWDVLLPRGNNTTVLDLGCGWGGVTTLLAKSHGEIVGADMTLETLQFLNIRVRQESLNDISLVNISPLDYGELPFLDEYFDAVILNGVLEYVGGYKYEESPTTLQKRCPKEISRILKPGGAIYIGIENRFSFIYFVWIPDHGGLRCISVVPRSIASLMSMYKRGKPYRNYTYSSKGYMNLLKKSGFSKIEFFNPIGHYTKPEALHRFGSKKSIIATRNRIKECTNQFGIGKTIITFLYSIFLRILALIIEALGIEELFCESYCIIGKKT